MFILIPDCCLYIYCNVHSLVYALCTSTKNVGTSAMSKKRICLVNRFTLILVRSRTGSGVYSAVDKPHLEKGDEDSSIAGLRAHNPFDVPVLLEDASKYIQAHADGRPRIVNR